MRRIILFVGATIVMAACAEAPTSPAAIRKAPSAAPSHDEIFCESGYILAYDDDGNPVCIPDPNGGSAINGGGGSAPRAPSSTKPTTPPPGH